MEKKECLDRTWPQGELLYWNSPTDEMKKKENKEEACLFKNCMSDKF